VAADRSRPRYGIVPAYAELDRGTQSGCRGPFGRGPALVCREPAAIAAENVASVPIPKFASLCCTLVCGLRNRRTLRRVLINAGIGRSKADIRPASRASRLGANDPEPT